MLSKRIMKIPVVLILIRKPMAYFIRGIGLVKTIEDIQRIVVKSNSSGISGADKRCSHGAIW